MTWIPGALSAATVNHADAPGIDWYAGDVAGAFALAAHEHKPVFLYWGAQWCPPCLQLKSSVFARRDFIAKTRQFVPVYLDGDDPGAQKWGEKFHVRGYPTVVILRPDQREVTRISGGLDLSVYAELLDIAESDIRPIVDVLSVLKSNPASLTRTDCQRLAYYAWELADYTYEDRSAWGTALAGAARVCADVTPSERARLTVTATLLAQSVDSVAQISAIIGDAALAVTVADVLEGLDTSFFAAVLAAGPAASGKFQRDWERTMNLVADDSSRIDADRLVALGAKLAVARQFSAPAPLPQPLVDDARRRAQAALARNLDAYVRAGVVNAVSFIYDQIGDDGAQESLLRDEIRTARSPYYYMADLGEMEEKHGHRAQALAWFERAYRESQGDATRFQWGNLYLGALLRLAPEDRQRIRETAASVLASLDGAERIQARTRYGLEKLDGRLRQWNAGHRYDADLKAIHQQMQQICARLPATDAGLESCRNFLAGSA